MDVEIPKLVKCHLCSRYYHQKILFQILVEDQGGSFVPKLACDGCLEAAYITERIPPWFKAEKAL